LAVTTSARINVMPSKTAAAGGSHRSTPAGCDAGLASVAPMPPEQQLQLKLSRDRRERIVVQLLVEALVSPEVVVAGAHRGELA
jgi:hypothetical protein